MSGNKDLCFILARFDITSYDSLMYVYLFLVL